MLIRAISDQHGNLPEIEPCDMLLIAGDICPTSNHKRIYQRHWLDTNFRAWLEYIPVKHIVGIAGNHDFIYEARASDPKPPDDLPWTYLQDSSVEIEGIKIYGTPWQPWFYNWAFNLQEEELEKKWELIPDDTDILIVHGPPANYGDRTAQGDRTGSPSLFQKIKRVKPEYVICGHIHEDHGEWKVGDTTVVNASILDLSYILCRDPYEFELSK